MKEIEERPVSVDTLKSNHGGSLRNSLKQTTGRLGASKVRIFGPNLPCSACANEPLASRDDDPLSQKGSEYIEECDRQNRACG